MPRPHRTHARAENRLLAALPRAELDRLLPDLERVPLSLREVLCEVDGAIVHVHFPLSGVVSLVLLTEGGLAVEVVNIGNEGMVGTPVFLGTDRSPIRAITQVPGEALRMTAEAFAEEMRRGGPLHELVRRSTQAMIIEISQSTVCNHLHSVEKRMCRWLLKAHDRVGADEFPLTQEFLAQMLGVRRPTVTAVAGVLQKAGLITYHRGRMTVVDRQGLEAASCECYRVVRKELGRLLGRSRGDG